MMATDGSEASKHATDIGISLAKLSAGKAIGVYVVDTQRLVQLHGYASFQGLKESLLNAMLREAEDALVYIDEKSKESGISYDKVILEGNPSEEIIKYAEESDVDVLVVGSIGRTGISRFLLGSVAEKVVRHAKVSVIVVPF